MRKNSGECANHLLLHCPVAMALWNMIFSLFRISWVMPRSVKELFLSWSLLKRRRKSCLGGSSFGCLLDYLEGAK